VAGGVFFPVGVLRFLSCGLGSCMKNKMQFRPSELNRPSEVAFGRDNRRLGTIVTLYYFILSLTISINM